MIRLNVNTYVLKNLAVEIFEFGSIKKTFRTLDRIAFGFDSIVSFNVSAQKSKQIKWALRTFIGAIGRLEPQCVWW